MHTHQSSPIGGVGVRSALFSSLILFVVTSLLMVCVPSAQAADGSQYALGQYGEVPTAHFGGFDSTWYDNGAFDGSGTESAPAAGKFLYPVGFTVDTSDASAPDGTAVYVLDRISANSETVGVGGTRWRLQKLSDAGALLGVTEFSLPKTGPNPCDEFYEPVGLAVTGGNVYTVIDGSIGECFGVDSAHEVVGWSTTPAAGVLVPAGGTPDSLSAPVTVGTTTYQVPSVVSDDGDLTATPIYQVHGLTADGAGALAILGSSVNPFEASVPGAPALVARVSTSTGAETATWSSDSLSGFEGFYPDSISTEPAGGDLDVLLGTEASSNPSLIRLAPDLTSPQVLESEAQEPSDPDQAPFFVAPSALLPSAGSHGTLLSNGLFASTVSTDHTPIWNSQDGIRLTSPLGDGSLSAPGELGTVYDTLARTGAAGSACDLSAGQTAGSLADLVLAAGESGSVWALNVVKEREPANGRVVTELSPDGSAKCLAPPAGTTFSLTDESSATPTPQLASAGPITVSVGSKVRFSTAPFQYPTTISAGAGVAGAFAFEWDPLETATSDPGYTLVQQDHAGGTGLWPLGTTPDLATAEEYTYTTPGTYTVKMKALGELGEYDATGKVIVETSSPPTAAFTLPGSAEANQTVEFNTSGSVAHAGARITNYHWTFGDGQEDDNPAASETHAYAAPGTYTVTLTVTDDNNQQSTAVTHQITVTAASTGTGTGTGGGGSTGGGGTTTTTPPPSGGGSTGGGAKPTPKPKPAPSKTQKLATALKQCKRKSPGKKRKACEKQAKAKYAPKKSKK
jgi:PKD repeat protein